MRLRIVAVVVGIVAVTLLLNFFLLFDFGKNRFYPIPLKSKPRLYVVVSLNIATIAAIVAAIVTRYSILDSIDSLPNFTLAGLGSDYD